MKEQKQNWYNFELAEQMYNKFEKIYPSFDFDKFKDIARNGDLKEFRLICNAIAVSDYRSSYFNNDLNLKSNLIEECNNRVNKVLGAENSRLYDLFIKSQKHELWRGDERYKLFGYDLGVYSERTVILSVVTMTRLLGSPLRIDMINEIGSLYNHGLHWNLYPEGTTSDLSFEEQNLNRKMNVIRWITFMNYVWRGEYDEAYTLIEDYELLVTSKKKI